MIRALTLLLAFLLSTPALAQDKDPILVPDISQHEIVLQQGFTGATLLLYGAVLDPADSDAQVAALALRGPHPCEPSARQSTAACKLSRRETQR